MKETTKKIILERLEKASELIEKSRIDDAIEEIVSTFSLEKTEKDMYGAPTQILHLVGKRLGKKVTEENLDKYLGYCHSMWDSDERDRRVCIAHTLGAMHRIDPERMTTEIFKLVETSNNWEESDITACYGCENLVRKHPDKYLPLILPYLESNNVWVLRGALVILYRLPMKRSEYTGKVLEAVEPLLTHEHEQVKKQNKFGVGILNRGNKEDLINFIRKYKNTDNPTIVQVLQEACWKLGDDIAEVVKVWENSENPRIQRTAKSIHKRMKKGGEKDANMQ